jgi:hypothetical protein
MKTIIITLITLLLFSCSKSETEYQPVNLPDWGVVTNPTYNIHVKPILDARCVSCHTNLSTYQGAFNSGNGNLVCKIDSSCDNNNTHSSILTPYYKDILITWINQGMPN